MTGFYGSKNICDFILFKSPYMYYIESKATWEARFDFGMITDTQRQGLLSKSRIDNVFGFIIVLFASYQRAFIFDVRDIQALIDSGKKSLNINKLSKWGIPYYEIPAVPNNRKKLLDYTGEIEDCISNFLR